MRFVSALGALVFAYLALIPGGLLLSTLDSACAGEGCDSSVASGALFSVLYGVCVLVLLGTAGLFATHALRGSAAAQQRLVGGMQASMAVIAVTAFALFAFAAPTGAMMALLIASFVYATLAARRHLERRERARRVRDSIARMN